MRRGEILCALAVLAWAGLMLRESVRLNIWWGASGPGAGFFPFWLSVGLTLTVAGVLAQALGPRPASAKKRFIPEGALPSLLKVVLPIAGMILAMEAVGYYVAAALYLGLSMRWIGRHGWPMVVGVSLLFPVATYVVMERWFLISLPKGYLGGYLPF